MHQFGWLSERGGNFLNLLQKEGVPRKRLGVPTQEETVKVVSPPPGKFLKPDVYSKKLWRRMQHIANKFWSRWRKEYLQSLQERQKWTSRRRNFRVDDIVLLKQSNIP